MKKILLFFVTLLTTFFSFGQITLTTTSNSAFWSPTIVTNNSEVLTWTASGGGINQQTIYENDPVFDLSENTGIVTIVIESIDNFIGLSRLDLRYLGINSLNIPSAINLQELTVRGNRNLRMFDTSNLISLETYIADVCDLEVVDFSQNNQLKTVWIHSNDLTYDQLDQAVIDLNINGSLTGTLRLTNQSTRSVLSYYALDAFNSLIQKGWTFDVNPPEEMNVQTISFTTTSQLAVWKPPSSTNFGVPLTWTVSGGVPTETKIDPGNDTIEFDLSANTGVVYVTIESTDGFAGFWRLWLSYLDVSNLNLSAATNMERLNLRQNPNLGTIDLSFFPNLDRIGAEGTNLVSIDVSNKPLLNHVFVNLNDLPTDQLDKILIDLDANGTPNGFLSINYQSTGALLSAAAQIAYLNLRDKGWVFDLPEIDVRGNGQSILGDGSNLPSSLDNTDFGVVNFGEEIIKMYDILNLGDINPQGAPLYLGPSDLILTSESPFVEISGPNANDFSISTIPSRVINGQGSTSLAIRFNPTSVGQKEALVTINNTDFNERSFTFNISGNVLGQLDGPEISVSGNAITIIGDGTNTPELNDNTDFGSTNLNTPVLKTFSIQNVGNLDLELTGTPLITITGSDASDFLVSALPTNPISPADSSDFVITFNASSLGLKNAVINVASNDLDEPNFVFNIQAEAVEVPINQTITLRTSSSASNWQLGRVTNGGALLDWQAVGTFGTISVSGNNNPTFDLSANTTNASIDISISSSDDFDFLTQLDLSLANNPGINSLISEINLQHAESLTTFAANNSSLTSLDISQNTALERLFIIGNNRQLNNQALNTSTNTQLRQIRIDGSGINSVDFTNNTLLTFVRLDNASLSAAALDQVLIQLDTYAENVDPFDSKTLNYLGQTTGATPTAVSFAAYNSLVSKGWNISGAIPPDIGANQIMITQYYSGNAVSRYLEIKNISGDPIPASTYYLALYRDAPITNIENARPDVVESIQAMNIDEVFLFKSVDNPETPTPAHFGPATSFTSLVCSFDGNDVILISSTSDETAYSNRQDIIGYTDRSEIWGSNTTFIKGGCASETAHLSFDKDDWIEIFPISEVDNANPNTNLALGTQVLGPTEFDGVGYANLESDRTRTVIFNTNFFGADFNIPACDLIVNSGVTAEFVSDNDSNNNSILLYGDLVTDGTLIIGDTQSLVTYGEREEVTLGVITKIEKSEPLSNLHDNTYWSSPVANPLRQQVFENIDPTRIFEYRADNVNPIYGQDSAYKYWWNVPTGPMSPNVGYAAEGPGGSEFPVDGADDYLAPNGIRNTLRFTGIPNNGSQRLNVYYKGSPDVDEENDNFNLIGNPYPTAIDIDLFLNSNTALNEIALWQHNQRISNGNGGVFTSSDYVYYSLSGPNAPPTVVGKNIGSGQGFMARTIAEPDVFPVIFENRFKLKNANDQFFKGEVSKGKSENTKLEQDRLWLALNDGRVTSYILVGFFEGATDALDKRYDATGGLGSKNIRFYSQIEDHKLSIQGLGKFTVEKSIELGFDIKEPKDLTLSFAYSEGMLKEEDLYLVDHLLNKTHNLKDGAYQFNQTKPGDFPNRFTLQFSKNALAVEEIRKDSQFAVSNVGEGFQVRAGNLVKEINVYDVLGRRLVNKKPNLPSFNLDVPNIKTGAVLIFELQLIDGVILSKKVLKLSGLLK